MSYGFKYTNGSFIINNNGRVDTVTSSNKLQKDLYKFLITDNNNNQYRYGTAINTLIGQKLKPNSVIATMTQYLKNALINFQQIQHENPFLTSDETMDNASLSIWQDETTKTDFNFQIIITLPNGTVIDDMPVQTLSLGKLSS